MCKIRRRGNVECMISLSAILDARLIAGTFYLKNEQKFIIQQQI